MKVRLSKRRKVGLVDIIGLSKIMFRYEFKGLFIKKGVKVRKSIVNNSKRLKGCLLYTSPSPRDATLSRMPSSA